MSRVTGKLAALSAAAANSTPGAASFVGAGISMEGVDQNPVYYEVCPPVTPHVINPRSPIASWASLVALFSTAPRFAFGLFHAAAARHAAHGINIWREKLTRRVLSRHTAPCRPCSALFGHPCRSIPPAQTSAAAA